MERRPRRSPAWTQHDHDASGWNSHTLLRSGPTFRHAGAFNEELYSDDAGGGNLASTLERTVTLSDTNDLLSVQSMTSTLKNNNRTPPVYDAGTRTFTETSPMDDRTPL